MFLFYNIDDYDSNLGYYIVHIDHNIAWYHAFGRLLYNGNHYCAFGIYLLLFFFLLVMMKSMSFFALKLQSERIYNGLCTLKWYELPLAEQKMYALLLVHAQEPKVFYLAGVKPLNMDTYTKVSSFYDSPIQRYQSFLFHS